MKVKVKVLKPRALRKIIIKCPECGSQNSKEVGANEPALAGTLTCYDCGAKLEFHEIPD